MAELKPCPFCGKSMTMYESGGCFLIQHEDKADDASCTLLMPEVICMARTRAEAVEKWNRRANDV